MKSKASKIRLTSFRYKAKQAHQAGRRLYQTSISGKKCRATNLTRQERWVKYASKAAAKTFYCLLGKVATYVGSRALAA